MPLRNTYDGSTKVRIEDTIRAEFVTPEEEERLEQYREQMISGATIEERKASFAKSREILFDQVQRYIAARGTKEAILADVEAILEAITKEEWEQQLAWSKKLYEEEIARMESDHNEQYGREATPEYQRYLEMLEEDSKNSLYSFLAYIMQYRIIFQVNALVRFTTPRTGLDVMLLPYVEKRYKVFYPDYEKQPEEKEAPKQPPAPVFMEDYMQVFHDKTRYIARAARKKANIDRVSGTGRIVTSEMEIELAQYEKLEGSLGVQEDKLFETAKVVFTKNNSGGAAAEKINYKVRIPLTEYATMLGYKVTPALSGDETPEANKKEITRARESLKDARKKVKRSLNIIYAMSVSLTEKIKGKEETWRKRRLVSGVDIVGSGYNAYIEITFAQDYAAALTALPLSNFSMPLLSVDPRNANAYILGKKLIDHFSHYNNHGKGTAQLLKVKTLLEYVSLPNIEAVRKQEKSWVERIKEPLEEALDIIHAAGVLEDWRYSKPKGEELTDKEAAFTSYEEWEDTLVYFTPKDAEDLAEQITETKNRSIERSERKAENKKKSGKK